MTSGQRRLVFILAGVSALLGIGLTGWLMWTTVRNITSPKPPTGNDRRLVLTAEALQKFGGPTPNAAAESLSAIGQFDGSRTINYEYDTRRDPNAETRLNTTTITMIHPHAFGAIQSFKVQQVTTKAGISLAQGKSGAKLIDMPSLLSIGDDHYAGVVKYKEQTSGHLFVVRQGRIVFTVLIFGIVFEDPEAANAVMLPLVEEAKKRTR